ncbi:hypothetical protein C943_01415 [Mariniradius saccharolyticus AK6]|uniref:Uncharacterized protein n=1 Tax=Mariniradius saccharolyticus AK6 TaxID=1239962 RepID=M7XBZ8_9BACT|nr:hypothetical protein C943_01415 [Mariniradius saccharolyticus AK6]
MISDFFISTDLASKISQNPLQGLKIPMILEIFPKTDKPTQSSLYSKMSPG